MRPEEAIRALLRAGGVRRPEKGDHINIKMPNGQVVTLSGLRSSVRIGILEAMLRKAGLSEDEFLDLLGRRKR